MQSKLTELQKFFYPLGLVKILKFDACDTAENENTMLKVTAFVWMM